MSFWSLRGASLSIQSKRCASSPGKHNRAVSSGCTIRYRYIACSDWSIVSRRKNDQAGFHSWCTPRFLNLSTRASRSVEGGRLEGEVQTGDFLFKLFLDSLILLNNLIVKHVPELPAVMEPEATVKEIRGCFGKSLEVMSETLYIY